MNIEQRLLPIQQFEAKAAELKDRIYWRQPHNREYTETSWQEAWQQTLKLAAGLQSLGLQAGDRVAIYSENCADWFLTDFAISAAGLISVPIYFTAGEKTISYVLEHSGAKAIVVGKLGNYAHLDSAVPSDIISIAMPYDTWPCQHQITDLIANSEPLADVAQPSLDDVFSISYTSGSTGNPKGVVLTFRNIVYGATAMFNLRPPGPHERIISYLPLAHITERALVEYSSLYAGATVSFIESLATFPEDLRNADVTSFLSVPRLWMKFQAGVLAKLPQKKLDRLLKIPVVSGMIKRKVRAQLGLSGAAILGSGSAPIAPSVLEWYQKLGMDISEGWGMTELTGVATSHYPFRADKIGTIGKAVDGLDVKISDEGEILVRGDGVFKEYYKNEEVTKETFTDDGWMRTGDRASLDDDGFLRITGRVKELFKTGKGKYVAPVPIESMMGENQLIEQICVMGSGLPAPKAVVVIAKETSGGLSQDQITQSLQATLDKVNSRVEKHECLDGICVAKDEWTVDNGLLTPTLKIKRDRLEAKYEAMIASEGQQPVIWE